MLSSCAHLVFDVKNVEICQMAKEAPFHKHEHV